MTRVGLTGGIGSGKSTVSTLLAERGAVIIDSDVLAREVVSPGTDGLHATVAEFGDGILAPDGSLDRPALGRRVFGDESARRALEAIIHPRVRRRAAEIEAAAPHGAVVVHDIPLLVETGRAGDFDAVIVVDVPVDVQVERLAESRRMPEPEARSRIRAQASREERRAAATYVIENTGSLDDLAERVGAVWRELVAD